MVFHRLPDVSFITQIPQADGWTYTNHPSADFAPESVVYITQLQTDGMGLGAWYTFQAKLNNNRNRNKAGRGDIPCAWEVQMDDSWLQPSLLEMFYTESTDNDYFVGSLSGPGYASAFPKIM